MTKKVPTELGTEKVSKLLMQYAIPAIDLYDEAIDELHISFLWAFPLIREHGDLWRLQSEFIPELHAYANGFNAEFRFHTIII